MKNILAIKYGSMALAGFAAMLSFYHFFISAPQAFPAGSIFSVREGSVLTSISQDLKEKGIIRSKPSLEFFAILFGGDRHIVAGDYFFDRPISAWSVAYRLAAGAHHIKALKITIPEGFNVKGIADELKLNIFDFDRQKFLASAGGLEGYLFPDTYFFYPNTTPNEIIRIMKDNFSQKIAPLADGIKKSARTEGEIITMASLIEKESGGPGDKAYISGILWKRIKMHMPLQVDATIVYLTGRDGKDITPDDFKIQSPYNTYIHLGLPPAPIANPGIDSIKAAIYPEDSPYLFYLHDKGGNIHYARTFQEHQQNEIKYLQ
jgi:UPF0755 protein